MYKLPEIPYSKHNMSLKSSWVVSHIGGGSGAMAPLGDSRVEDCVSVFLRAGLTFVHVVADCRLASRCVFWICAVACNFSWSIVSRQLFLLFVTYGYCSL